MEDSRDIEIDVRKSIESFRTKIQRDFVHAFNEVNNCECAHNLRLHDAVQMEINKSKYALTPIENMLCILIVLVIALGTYIGMTFKTIGPGCNCGSCGHYY